MSIDDDVAALPEPARSRVQTAATVMLALRFSELARERAKEAEANLVEAMNRAERAHDYLKRTTTTLEQALRLHAMGRD